MISIEGRAGKKWTVGKNPGDNCSDQAILAWLQTPHNAARFIRWFNYLREGMERSVFINDLVLYINNNSTPQRDTDMTYKRIGVFDKLSKLSNEMLSQGVNEKTVLKRFPYYHEFTRCMEKGLEVLRQELDEDGSYDRLFKIYQPIHITQSTRAERRLRRPLSSNKSALRNASSEAPSTTRATTSLVETQPSTRSISSTPVVTKNTVAVPSSSSNMSDTTTCNDQRNTLSTPSRSNRRRLNIANDNTLPLRRQPRVVSASASSSSSSSSSLSHQSPSLSQRSNHNSPSPAIQPDNPSSSTSTSLEQSNTQQQSDNMISPEVTSKDLMQLIRETNKGIRQIVKVNRKIKKRRSAVEKSLLALSRAREMEIQANLISRMIESGFSKEEICQVINK